MSMPSLEADLRRATATGRYGFMDEAGRGALAGVVTCAIVVITPDTPPAPDGIRDSKTLTPARREHLSAAIREWAPEWAVGHATPEEIETHGLTAALRYAAWRALTDLPTPPPEVLLDGNHDYITERAPSLFETLTPPHPMPQVRTLVKADTTSTATAAASILAKTTRDELMTEAHHHHPEYNWDTNAGYGTPGHLRALREYGPSPLHRHSWLPKPTQAHT